MNEITEKPKFGSLIGNSVNFFAKNMGSAWLCLKPVFVPLILLLILSVWVQMKMQFADVPVPADDGEEISSSSSMVLASFLPLITSMLIGIPQVFLMGCVVLSWHRKYILGPEHAEVINPLSFKGGELRGVLNFLSVSYLPFVIIAVFSALVGGIYYFVGQVAFVSLFLLFPLYIYGLIQVMRIAFVFPALALGHDVSWMEAREMSKGLLLRFFGATLVLGLILMVPNMFFTFVSGIVGAIVGSLVLMMVLMTVLTNIIMFIGMYLYASVLSQLYAWAIHNKRNAV